MDDLVITDVHAWDENCEMRAHDIESGADGTYNKVLLPYVLNILERRSKPTDVVLDVGSGCGFLTSKIAAARHIDGVDISRAAIEYSGKKYSDISFYYGDACTIRLPRKYNFALANMVVHNIPDLPGFYRNVCSLIENDGFFLMILLHPHYWAREKLADSNFIYGKQRVYSHKLKNCRKPVKYYHRPFEYYLSSLRKAGFSLRGFEEVFEEYDGIRQHEFPHILSILASRVSDYSPSNETGLWSQDGMSI